MRSKYFGLLHHGAARFARSQILVAIKFFKDTLELTRDVGEFEIFFVEFLVTVFAKPEQAI